VAGEKLAGERFEIKAGEERSIDLVVKTVYFEAFDLVPNYRTETEELAFAQLVYTIKNLYRPVDSAEVILHVSFDGDPLDEVSLVSLSPLEMGRLGLNYNYIPAAGWESGSYGFRLELELDGATYATTAEKLLSVVDQPSQPASLQPVVTTWMLILVVVVLVGVVAGGMFLLVARRRKKRHSRT
jgi:hypothetical protein